MSIAFRPFSRTDYPTLLKWRRDTAWLRWWGPERTSDELEDDYGETIDGIEPTRMAIATYVGRDIALVESYLLRDHPAWDAKIGIEGAAGIDYGIGNAADRGHGLGRELLIALVKDVFEEYDECDVIVAAPKSANTASCRVLTSVGFDLVRTEHIEGEYPASGTSSIFRIERGL